MARKTNRTQTEVETPTAKPEMTPEAKKKLTIEMTQWGADFSEKDGREQLAAAMDLLRRKADEIEREIARPERDLAKSIYFFRHTLAWACANIESNLSNADTRAIELAAANATLKALAE